MTGRPDSSYSQGHQKPITTTKGETIIQVHGIGPSGLTYVNPADDPRKK